ncbi:hypothetical protein SteCoe_34604 [Stentor coeruleus]|uniref:Uncharacterized protein n=1 Tax=Stentor coeruleus TaxID=5963 RepID=A0A1R2AUI2_9CILI|nr:hypothetical protein SteCoe_34604 [Stentor coeruleus]
MSNAPITNAENLEEVKKDVRSRISRHKISSIESLYSAGAIESFSISSCNGNSADSEAVKKVVLKNKEITDMVSSRLTAFLYMSHKCYEEGSFSSEAEEEIKDLKKSLDLKLEQYKENQDKNNEVLVKGVLEQIYSLEKEFVIMKKRLLDTETAIKLTEEEKMQLKKQMSMVEDTANKFICESHENAPGGLCNCVVV